MNKEVTPKTHCGQFANSQQQPLAPQTSDLVNLRKQTRFQLQKSERYKQRYYFLRRKAAQLSRQTIECKLNKSKLDENKQRFQKVLSQRQALRSSRVSLVEGLRATVSMRREQASTARTSRARLSERWLLQTALCNRDSKVKIKLKKQQLSLNFKQQNKKKVEQVKNYQRSHKEKLELHTLLRRKKGSEVHSRKVSEQELRLRQASRLSARFERLQLKQSERVLRLGLKKKQMVEQLQTVFMT